MTEQCRSCRFVKTTGRYLVCRRYPPTRTNPVTSQFPVVDPDEWCGEWLSQRKGDGLPAEIAPGPDPRPGGARAALMIESRRRIEGDTLKRSVVVRS